MRKMGFVYRKPYTMPLPACAEIIERGGERLARWKARNGRTHTAELIEGPDGTMRVRGRSGFYVARYRDGNDRVVQVATGCRDETAAKACLAQLERRVELVKAGIITDVESEAAKHGNVAIERHLDAFERHLHAKGGSARRIAMLRRRLDRFAEECGFTRLDKLDAARLEHWLVAQKEAGMSAATRNNFPRGRGGVRQLVPAHATADAQPVRRRATRRSQDRPAPPASSLDRD
jgi:hypothetical protein